MYGKVIRLAWVALTLLQTGPTPAQDGGLDEVLTRLDNPAATWDELGPRLREQGGISLERLLSLRPLVEQRLQATNLETRIVANEQLRRLDELIDLVAGQPYASVSHLFWHESLTTTLDEARRSHLPALVAIFPGGAKRHEVARLFAVSLYANEDISRALRERFILQTTRLSDLNGDFSVTAQSHESSKPPPGRGAHILLDASGRPVHAIRGFVTPAAFLRWLEAAAALANETYQLSDDAAHAIIARRHQRWSTEPEPVGAQPVLDMRSRSLFELERPWFQPGPTGSAELTSLAALEEFLEESEKCFGGREIHQFFIEGIFTKSLAVLQQKLQQSD